MPYFSLDDFASMATLEPDLMTESVVYQQLRLLREGVSVNLRTSNLKLHHSKNGIQMISAGAVGIQQVLSILLHRSDTEARTVERLMGREEVVASGDVDSRRHPVIEIRVTEHHLVFELIISPDAWWDQQNLVGKLSVPRHREEFYKLMRKTDDDYKMGFWGGIHLSEMHLTGAQFKRPVIMNEWLNTYEARKDWFRLGIWYEPESSLLDENLLIPELVEQIKVLYPIYEYLRWTGDNNFQDFYNASTT